jgi:hypothetical protein
MVQLLLLGALVLGQPGPELPALLPQGPPEPRLGAMPAADQAPLTEAVQAPLLPPPTPPAAPAATSSAPSPRPDRWFVMRELQGTWVGALLDDSRTSVTGWTDASYTASTDRVSNLPVTFNDRANTFLLQQFWIRVDRSVVPSGTLEPTFGYHLDVLVGSDYRWTLIRGLFNAQLDNSTGAQNLYGVDPIQFYGNAYVPTLFRGTEFRVGRVFNPWGYESLEALSTPLMSRSYAFFNTPFTFMGAEAITTLTPSWSTVVMLTNGNDVFLVPYQEGRFVGKLAYAAPDQRNTLQLGCSLGRGRFNAGAPFTPATVGLAQEPAGRNNFNAFDMVFTHVFNPAFTYVNETMYGWQTAVPVDSPTIFGGIVRPGSNSPGTAHWASSCHYLRATLSPRLGAILRFETFDDIDGQRTGFRGLYTAVTGGVQFRPRPWLLIRPEIRYDYNGESTPFEGKHGLLTAGSDVLVRW